MESIWRTLRLLSAGAVLVGLLVGLVCLVLCYLAVSEGNSSLLLRSLAGAMAALVTAWLVGRAARLAGHRATDLAIARHAESIRHSSQNAAAHHVQATESVRRGDHARAIAHCNAAIRLDPTRPYTYVTRVNSYGALGQWDRVIDEYGKIIEHEPGNALAYCARATAFNGIGRFDRSIPDATEAIRIEPTLFLGHDARGYGLLQQGRYNRAVRAVALIWMVLSLGFLRRDNPVRTMRLGTEADWRQAIADFTEAIRLHGPAWDCYQGRALAYRALGETDRAMEDEGRVQFVRKN